MALFLSIQAQAFEKGCCNTTCHLFEAINPAGYLTSELHRRDFFFL